jgi:EpsD family peptidyl-prolyl cis-trans isomerase
MRPARSLRLAAAAATLVLAGCSPEPSVPPGLVTPDEIHAFYVAHPALFESRRLYSLREIVVESPGAVIADIESHVAQSRSLQEVESWLAERGVAFETTSVTHAAEDVPLGILNRFAAMKAGDLAVMATPERAAVWELVAASDAPLTEEEARSVIEQYLAGHRRAPAHYART